MFNALRGFEKYSIVGSVYSLFWFMPKKLPSMCVSIPKTSCATDTYSSARGVMHRPRRINGNIVGQIVLWHHLNTAFQV